MKVERKWEKNGNVYRERNATERPGGVGKSLEQADTQTFSEPLIFETFNVPTLVVYTL